jgi:hypothetical protein
MIQAVEDVRNRLYRATTVLDAAQIPYAVIGGNAVAAWVSRVDKAAVRNTQDVDLLLQREDLERAKGAFAAAGFVYRHAASIDMFLDGPGAKARDAVHVIFADEKVRPTDPVPTPLVSECERTANYRLLSLEALVRMKLTSYRRKDQVHIQDLIEVGLVDATWLPQLPVELQERLQVLLDDPTG